MGDKRRTGVEPRDASIRISFQYKGVRCRETLKLDPTEKNLRYAHQLRQEICRRITIGTFNYAEYFPESPYIKKLGVQDTNITFLELARRWLATNDHLAYSTLKEYKGMLNRYFVPELHDVPVKSVTHSMLKEVVAKQNWTSMKTRNNALTPLRKVFEMAFLDGLIPVDPAAKLKMGKVQKPVPDPLTLEEVDLVLNWMKREPTFQNYFEFAFFTGLRTSELVALQWGDIDFHRQSVRVQRAKVRKRIKVTKTASVRDVELNSRALNALQRQKPRTFLQGEWIFLHPRTGEPMNDDKPPRLFWTSALKACGLRHRDAYQTRHTYATLNLMAGANPAWLAKQMGHSTPKMTFDRYARWIDGADSGKELNKLDRLLKVNDLFVPDAPRNAKSL